jgi:gluconolactonase
VLDHQVGPAAEDPCALLGEQAAPRGERRLGATTVVCCGAWTNWAVEHTCRDAADHGYEVVVVTDATATISEEFQRAALDFALTTVATRATADEVIVAVGLE